MVKLENITSVCEVALTANFVLGYLLLKYRDIRHKSIRLILKETQSIELFHGDNCCVFRNGNKFSVKAFNRIEALFIVSAILSIIAVITSFVVLLLSGVYPDYGIYTYLYVLFAVLFIIANPTIYFIAEISVLNFQLSIREEQIKKDEISEFVRSYISMPVYHESISSKIRWFLHFKIEYMKSIFKKMSKTK